LRREAAWDAAISRVMRGNGAAKRGLRGSREGEVFHCEEGGEGLAGNWHVAS